MQNKESEPQEVIINGEEFDLNITPDADIDEIGILYGWCHRSSVFILTAAAGVSYVHGVRRGELVRRDVIEFFEGGNVKEVYQENVFQTVGVPVALQISAQALPLFGIGLELFGNANPERSYIGVLLGIQFGHLR
jgi:hypothetical protein